MGERQVRSIIASRRRFLTDLDAGKVGFLND
jgi:hypothetical protein